MFDDLGLGNESRLLIVRVDEADGKAYMEWEYRLGALTQLFGDADPTVSGNVLGAFWIQEYGPDTRWGDAQAGIVEVTREGKEVAWQLLIEGDACYEPKCFHCVDRDDDSYLDHHYVEPHIGTWFVYSAERFYDGPVLPSINSRDRAECHGGQLRFTVFNSFKQSTRFSGTYALTDMASGKKDGDTIVEGGFEFKTHWRPTKVEAAVADRYSNNTDVRLTVTNSRGKSASVDLVCH